MKRLSTIEELKQDAEKMLKLNIGKRVIYICDYAGCLGESVCPIKQSGFQCTETR